MIGRPDRTVSAPEWGPKNTLVWLALVLASLVLALVF